MIIRLEGSGHFVHTFNLETWNLSLKERKYIVSDHPLICLSFQFVWLKRCLSAASIFQCTTELSTVSKQPYFPQSWTQYCLIKPSHIALDTDKHSRKRDTLLSTLDFGQCYLWAIAFLVQRELIYWPLISNLYTGLIKPWHCQWAQSVKGHPLDHSLSSWAFTGKFFLFYSFFCHGLSWSPTWALHLKCLLSTILISWSQKLDWHVIQYLTNPITCSTCMAHILRLYQVVSRSQYFPMFQCWLLLPRQSC